MYLNKNNKLSAQASIEFSLAFVLTLLFLVLTVRLFVWFAGGMVNRQQDYEDSRVEAASTSPGKLDFQKTKLDILSNDIFIKK